MIKGIILAGGSGTRLYPLTKSVSKQLLPVYNKPMIYYPLSTLMLAGIRQVLIISTPEDLPKFEQLLGDGTEIGMHFSYIAQPNPDGLAQAFILGKTFIADDDVCLILGDNIYYGHGMREMLSNAVTAVADDNMASVFGYHVNNPTQYGVIAFDNSGKALSIQEKPENPASNYAVTGLYFYPNDVVKKAPTVQPSQRGELEISTINQFYLQENRLKVQLLSRDYVWLDAGTHDKLLEAATFIETIERVQGLKVACIEEIAFERGYINKQALIKLVQPLKENQYGQYLLKRARDIL